MTTTLPHNIWQKTNGLVEHLLTTTSGLNFTYPDRWSVLLIVSLNQSNKSLHSVAWLLNNQDWESGVVLTRSMFELSANLAYIAKNMEKRLPEYLKHGKVPITAEELRQKKEEIQHYQQEVDNGIISNALNIIPTKSWKSMSTICRDLGTIWLNEYNSFFRYASISTHWGAFILGKSFMQLVKGNSPSDHELSGILITAVSFHIRVAKIVARKFPIQIPLEEVEKYETECNSIGKELIQKK